jgi:hypothetical protein
MSSRPEGWSEKQEAEYKQVLGEDKRLRQNIGILERSLRDSRSAHAVIAMRLDQLERQRNGEVTLPGLE